jgi:nicotinamidase-related amidase
MTDLRLTANNSLLLVIDVQERLLPAIAQESNVDIVANTRLLLQSARLFDVPIVVSEQYPKGLGPTVSPIAEVLDGHQPIAKTEFSCAQNNALQSQVTSHNRSHLVLCGIEAHVCVLQTALDYLTEGFRLHVVSDGVGSRTESNRQIGLGVIEQAGGVITSAETVAFQWAGRAGTESFKALSRLVR